MNSSPSIDPIVAEANRRRGWAACALVTLAVAVLAMAVLHVVGSALDPVRQPISFYLHGPAGGLLPLALASFGGTAWSMARLASARDRWLLALFACGMGATAVFPCDPFFPWEQRPGASGLVHAVIATVAPVLLLGPMFKPSTVSLDGARNAAARGCALAYVLGLVASGASLLAGLARDGPPPFIGVAERLLALSAAGWFAVQGVAARGARTR